MKRLLAFALALSFVTLLAAQGAEARKGRGGHDDAPECEVEDGGVLVCK